MRPGPDPDPDVSALDPVRARWPVYAELPRRRTRQFVADVAVLVWVAAVVSVAILLYDAVLGLQGPGRELGSSGMRVRETFAAASGTAARVPIVGRELSDALGGGTRAGDSLVSAGDQEVAAVGHLATGLSWVLVVLLLVPVLATWATMRVRWMLAARAALMLRDGTGDADVLALRGLVNGSPRRLRRTAPDAAGAWRRGEPAVLARLADLELARLGLAASDLATEPEHEPAPAEPA